MKIILEKEEYEALRPNAPATAFIEKIRQTLNEGPVGGDWHRLFQNIDEAFKDYDRDVNRAKDDDNFQLWPIPLE